MYRLLIADDEPLQRRALTQLIGRKLPEVEVVCQAANGEEAVAGAKEYHPHLVLMDIKMPGKNGLDAAKEILESAPETKVIMLTAYDEFSYAQTALQLGAVNYLLKPVRPNDLFQALERCLDGLRKTETQHHQSQQAQAQLAELQPQIFSSLVSALINGNPVSPESFCRSTGLPPEELFPLTLLVIGLADDPTHDPDLPGHIRAALHVPFAKGGLYCLTQTQPDKYLLLLPGLERQLPQQLAAYSQVKGTELLRALSAEGISASVGISSYCTGLPQFRHCYEEASFAEGFDLLSAADLEAKEVVKPRLEHHAKELTALIYASDWVGASRLFEQVWEEVKGSKLDADLKKAYLIEFLFNVHQTLNTNELDCMTVIKDILDCVNADTLGVVFHRAADAILLESMNWRSNMGTIVKTTKQFLDHNYHKDLSLNDVTDVVHVSPSYLSRVFSRELGVPFKKYLIDLRLDQAKRLLLSTNKLIGEVALAVGYQDTSYFCRIFKQREGCSPNQFRAQNK